MTRSHKNSNGLKVAFFVLFIAVAALAVYILSRDAPAESQPSPSPSPSEAQETAGPPDVAVDPTPDVTVFTSPPAPSPSEAVAAGPDLAAREAVGDEFFSDAAFMGNSLMDGFRLFSGLTTCDYYAATSMTVIGAESKVCITLDDGRQGTLLQGLAQKPYGKIYILLGINEIGYEVGAFIDYYSDMLDQIIASQPDADIYIMGLTPVSAAKSRESDTFNMTRIGTYNTALRQLAADKACYYMDLVAALAGPDGYLPAEETTDGIHLSVKLYQMWLDCVKTHYI